MLGNTSHSKFPDWGSSFDSHVQKHVLYQRRKRGFGERWWEDEGGSTPTQLWPLCGDVGGGSDLTLLVPKSD